ncbi:MAG TPA: superoxide dismutase [Burkholderiales bacterium]|nr:superoxide dismutase [Burkholderiales bacterium]
MPISLPELPFPSDALAPYISAQTLSIHHGKHHRAYVDKTNALAGKAGGTLEEIIVRAAGDSSQKALFNNAAQAWNHAFYWRSLRPRGGTTPREFLKWTEELKAAATGLFGSGWAWLVREGADLKVVTTSNADTPFIHGQTPLLVIDVWEHAYYLDHHDRRAEYVTAVVDRLLNWDFAAANLRAIPTKGYDLKEPMNECK